MTIANRVADYLVEQGAEFDVVNHPYSSTSMESAQLAHIPGDLIAKSVVLEDDRGYLLAVLPASCRVDLGELHRQTNRNLGLATEYELDALFEDCEPGAVPPLATVYEMDAIVDDGLAEFELRAEAPRQRHLGGDVLEQEGHGPVRMRAAGDAEGVSLTEARHHGAGPADGEVVMREVVHAGCRGSTDRQTPAGHAFLPDEIDPHVAAG